MLRYYVALHEIVLIVRASVKIIHIRLILKLSSGLNILITNERSFVLFQMIELLMLLICYFCLFTSIQIKR